MHTSPGPDAPPADAAPASALRAVLRADLEAALRARQAETVALLRTLIAAIDNAEAVAVTDTAAVTSSTHIAGAQAGVGATEAARRVLSASDLRALLQEQIDERSSAADLYDTRATNADAAHVAAAHRLRREAEGVRTYLAAIAANDAVSDSVSDAGA